MKQLVVALSLSLAGLLFAACGADPTPSTVAGRPAQTLASAAEPGIDGACAMAGTGDCSTCPHNQDGQCNCPNHQAGGTPGTCPHHQAGQGMNGQAGGCPGMGGQGMGGQGMGGQGMGGQGAGRQGMNGQGTCPHKQAQGAEGQPTCPHHQAGASGQQ